MAIVNSYPKDLAYAVFSELESRKLLSPNEAVLNKLFETLYFVSLKTEEQQPITCHIVYLSPDQPDPKPPERIVRDRWSYVTLKDRVSFTISDLIKLARASDPRTSSFAVYHDKDEQLYVWGIIDQGNSYHDFVNFDIDEGPERPGLFQTSIIGIGHIAAYIGYEKIAELRTNILFGKALNVLQNGSVYQKLSPAISHYIEMARPKLPNAEYIPSYPWEQILAEYWISSLCRLLLRIQNYRHGGAILITPDKSYEGLKIKYGIRYNRLRSALEEYADANIQRNYARGRILFNYVLPHEELLPTDLYVEEVVQRNLIKETSSELEATIWFISLLSRVDGLVLMNTNLEVMGFGVEITYKDEPIQVFRANNEFATKKEPIEYTHFGTRHRSMMRYCSQNPDSIGFVISQDGDVRVITVVRKKLVMWENIQLQRDISMKNRQRKHNIRERR